MLPLFLTVSSSVLGLLCGRKEQHQQLEEGGRRGRKKREEHLGAESQPRCLLPFTAPSSRALVTQLVAKGTEEQVVVRAASCGAILPTSLTLSVFPPSSVPGKEPLLTLNHSSTVSALFPVSLSQ